MERRRWQPPSGIVNPISWHFIPNCPFLNLALGLPSSAFSFTSERNGGICALFMNELHPRSSVITLKQGPPKRLQGCRQTKTRLFFAKGISVLATKRLSFCLYIWKVQHRTHSPRASEGAQWGPCGDAESGGLIVSFSSKPSSSQRITGNLRTDDGGTWRRIYSSRQIPSYKSPPSLLSFSINTYS